MAAYGVKEASYIYTESRRNRARQPAEITGLASRGWRRRDHVEGRMKKAASCSARCHPGADLGAQLVDQPKTLLGLDVPEGPAIAGAGALGDRADTVDRADLVAEHDGAVGADQSAVALLGIDQLGAGRNHAALDQFGECDAR